jgi:DNA-binding protein YbaB
LMAAQAELAETVVNGTAGGVEVSITGTGDLTAVTVTPGAFDANDTESLADLGDLVVAAYRDARSKAEALASSAMSPFSGALGGDLGALGGGPTPGPLGFGPAGS